MRTRVQRPVTLPRVLPRHHRSQQYHETLHGPVEYIYVFSRVRVTIDGDLNRRMDLLTTYTHGSELQAVTTPPLIAIHKSPQHPLSLFQPAASSPAVPL
jgi:hypothetical protein